MNKQKITALMLIGAVALTGCTVDSTDVGSIKDIVALTGSTTTESGSENLPINIEVPMAKYEAPALENGDIVATIKTNLGTIKLKLFTKEVPKTTANFMGLSTQGYYNDVTFHRVIKDFMIQGGDPEGTGAGGTSIYGKNFADEFHPDLKNNRGTISMANAGPNTNGSQFFINVNNNNSLDNMHSVFGQVTEGMDIADKISKLKTLPGDKPEKEVTMINITLSEYKDGALEDYSFDVESAKKGFEAEEAARKEQNKDRLAAGEDTVVVHYKGMFEDGSTFDSSYDKQQPLEITLGAQQVIPGFENSVIGMKIGDKKTVTLSPDDAYGEYDETKTQDFPKADLEAQGVTPIEGQTVPSMMGELKVLKVTDTTVTLDINHPLVGKTLIFDLELVDFKD